MVLQARKYVFVKHTPQTATLWCWFCRNPKCNFCNTDWQHSVMTCSFYASTRLCDFHVKWKNQWALKTDSRVGKKLPCVLLQCNDRSLFTLPVVFISEAEGVDTQHWRPTSKVNKRCNRRVLASSLGWIVFNRCRGGQNNCSILHIIAVYIKV